MSTLSSNLANDVSLTIAHASSTLWRFSRSYFLTAAARFLASFGMVILVRFRKLGGRSEARHARLAGHVDAHRTRRTRDAASRGVDVARVHVGHLLFRDLFDLVPGELA